MYMRMHTLSLSYTHTHTSICRQKGQGFVEGSAQTCNFLCIFLSNTHTHIHIHAHTHTHIHTRTHCTVYVAEKSSSMEGRVETCDFLSFSFSLSLSLSLAHTHTHTHTHTYAPIHTPKSPTKASLYGGPRRGMQISLARTHTRTHTHASTYTHTHAHTLSQPHPPTLHMPLKGAKLYGGRRKGMTCDFFRRKGFFYF